MPRDAEESDYLYMLELIHLDWPDVEQIRSLTYTQCIHVLELFIEMNRKLQKSTPSAFAPLKQQVVCELAKCAKFSCGKTEPHLNTYKLCSACRKVK